MIYVVVFTYELIDVGYKEISVVVVVVVVYLVNVRFIFMKPLPEKLACVY